MRNATTSTSAILVAILFLNLLSQHFVLSITEENDECRLYFAPSTIPGAGLGIFAGIDFDTDDMVLYGDVAVPIDELPFHTGSTDFEEGTQEFFIWTDYTWDSTIAGGMNFDYNGGGEEIVENVELASFGLGAMPNCKFGFVNLHSDSTLADTAMLDRTSPGNGAFTPYHERVGYAKEPIVAGSELFEDYGPDYFNNRPDTLGHVPHDADYDKAFKLLKKLGLLRDRLLGGQKGKTTTKPLHVQSLLHDLYNVTKHAWNNSRVLNALPNANHHNEDDFETFFDVILNGDAKYFEKRQTIRDPAWLKTNGICMDGIRSGTSAIPHAGRGAFATRHFQNGTMIAPVPLIHLPDKDILTMYAPMELEEDEEWDDGDYYDPYATKERDVSKPIGKQLFLNYVFGHEKSSLLLSPYGTITSLINHGSGSDANARMVWARDWMRHPEWLEKAPEELFDYRYAGLGWNLIALRDIHPGEEVLIDYGPAWQAAWQEHVDQWYAQGELPVGTSFPYVPASVLNENIEQVLIDAVASNTDYSYMGHGVTLYCDYTTSKHQTIYAVLQDEDEFEAYHECRPKSMYKNMKGESVFVAEIVEWVENEKYWELLVHDVLFDVHYTTFHFEDLPFNTAHKMSWSFRHEMSIPDDIFPEAWMNLS